MQKLIKKFYNSISNYSDYEQNIILQAYEFAENKHKDQKRKTSDEYFSHPLSVALNLSERSFDYCSVSAALLHDLPENCKVELNELENIFGSEISSLVNGVTKISTVAINNKPLFFSNENFFADRIDNYRKLLLSTAKDIRVIIIKLFDRLHNIETIHGIEESKKRFYAIETIEIYAQIAERLGFGEIKRKLEDLSFPFAYPEDFKKFTNLLKSLPDLDESFINEKELEIKKLLKDNGLTNFQIQTRIKHQFSIFKKIKETYNFNLNKFFDMYGVRVIVNNIEDCYRVLGLLHTKYHPLVDRIYDMIAVPKKNGYQSLHTTVRDPSNKIFEIQIRTYEMHQVAEYGPAAHWQYKESRNRKENILSKGQREWLEELSSITKLNSNRDFLEYIKSDLFANKIFIFTPNGDIFNMPQGSSVIDFAFRIHSNLGEKCFGAKINNKITELSTTLSNGDTVEILTSSKAKPNIDWLRFTKTSYAKQKIKRFLRKEDYNRLLNIGKGIFTDIREQYNLPPILTDKLIN